MTEAPQIALFGGTFDPVHLGHLNIAAQAVSELGINEVRFLPCRISPHKQGLPVTPAVDRIEMLNRATKGLNWAVVDDFETRHDGPSYSWKTAVTMRERFPQARLFWIMGTDQWEALPTWSHPERLAACVEFIVFTRGQSPHPRDGYTMHALSGTHPASASEIRRKLASGTPCPEWLTASVSEWIESNGLYRSAETEA